MSSPPIWMVGLPMKRYFLISTGVVTVMRSMGTLSESSESTSRKRATARSALPQPPDWMTRIFAVALAAATGDCA